MRLHALLSKGVQQVRVVRRALALLQLDRGGGASAAARAVGLSPGAVRLMRVAARSCLARVAIALTVTACGAAESKTSMKALTDSVLASPAERLQVAVDTLATGLEVPWGLAQAPDGRIFVTERAGRIRVLSDGKLDPAAWATLAVHSSYLDWGPESGLLGIALSPSFAENRHVFVMATATMSERPSGSLAGRMLRRLARTVSSRAAPLPVKSQIIRLSDRDGRGVDPVVIIDNLPANHYHAGGGLTFGPDGKLYASVGDVTRPELAPSARSLADKVLRFNADGSIPADNPDPASAVWASGLRNTQAFLWLPDGTMLGVEHGPTGMPQEGSRAGEDELNLLSQGADYGWPSVTGWQVSATSRRPIWVWNHGLAPAGMTLWESSSSGDTATILVGGLHRRLERLRLVRGQLGDWRVTAGDTLLGPKWGRIRTLMILRDGSALVTTSNRDARGQPGPGDDLLLRLSLERAR